MKLSRRSLATALFAGAPALAQSTTQAEAGADDLTIQRDQMRKNSEAVAKVQISATLEPTFVFKA